MTSTGRNGVIGTSSSPRKRYEFADDVDSPDPCWSEYSGSVGFIGWRGFADSTIPPRYGEISDLRGGTPTRSASEGLHRVRSTQYPMPSTQYPMPTQWSAYQS